MITASNNLNERHCHYSVSNFFKTFGRNVKLFALCLRIFCGLLVKLKNHRSVVVVFFSCAEHKLRKMFEFNWWMTVQYERDLLFWITCGMTVCALFSFAVLLIIPAPYGRYCSSAWGVPLDSRFAWFIQELPSLLVPIILWLCNSTTPALVNRLLLGAYVIHYVHRYMRLIDSLIYLIPFSCIEKNCSTVLGSDRRSDCKALKN